MIPESLLLQYGGRSEFYKLKEVILQQGNYARNFYQIKKGDIQVTTINEDGKKFSQSVFTDGESFGEPALFVDISYPASAIAICDSELIILPKLQFFLLLKENPEYYLVLLNRLSQRLHYKSLIAQVISNEQAEQRILTLIDYLKRKENVDEEETYKVSLTRQQLADLIGLRVETVIRAIQELRANGHVSIRRGKIFR